MLFYRKTLLGGLLTEVVNPSFWRQRYYAIALIRCQGVLAHNFVNLQNCNLNFFDSAAHWHSSYYATPILAPEIRDASLLTTHMVKLISVQYVFHSSYVLLCSVIRQHDFSLNQQ